MSYSKDVDKAIRLATVAHTGAVDKSGAPYILHPERVAGRLRTPEEKVVGWLHDVVEDTGVTLATITEMFGYETATAVDAITHRKGESWSDYLIRVKGNAIAKAVKISDLTDNMNISRLSEIKENDIKRVEKYIEAYKFLTDMYK